MIGTNDKTEQIKSLVEKLNKYRDAYYNKSESLVSDTEYDRLYDELEQLEKETGLVMSNSPTQTVGYTVTNQLPKIALPHPMLSLAKTKNVQEFEDYTKGKSSIYSLKLDGLSVLLVYDNGTLQMAATRGDGYQAELITSNAKVFDNVPLTISYKGHLEVEGEAIITFRDFEKINAKQPKDKKFANPRNLASGSVRQLDTSITAQRHVKFIAWKVPYLTEIADDKNINSFTDRLLYARELGFEIVPFYYVAKSDILVDTKDYILKLKQWAELKSYPYDGFVHTFNDIKYGESLGMTGHHPKHSFVLKEQDEEVETTLKEVIWQMGKTGVLTPVAVFDPVEIDGTIVERASVHNVSILTKLELNPSDVITVYKSNMIIPQVKRNLSAEKRNNPLYVRVPTYCPVCGGETKIQRVNDSNVLICTNPDCKGKLLGKLKHFCSKDAMDIQGLSEQTLEKFINYGWLNSVADIYTLEKYKTKLSLLSGFGVKSTTKLLQAIEDSKHTTLDRFINALSIPTIGKEAAKVIAKNFDYSWIKFGVACTAGYNWQRLPDFGETMAKSINWFWKQNKDWVNELGSGMDFYNPDEDKVQYNTLNGMNFVITGKLLHFKNRDELVKKIEEYGGKVVSSVSKNTTYLINNDVNSNSSKNKKAKELGVKIITEEQFLGEF